MQQVTFPWIGFSVAVEKPDECLFSCAKNTRWVVANPAREFARQRESTRDADECHANAPEVPGCNRLREEVRVLRSTLLENYGVREVD